MEKIIKQIKNHLTFIFFLLDIVLIIFASFSAFLLRFDYTIPSVRFTNFFAFTVLAVLTTPIIFYFFNLYKISWKYLTLTDFPTIAKGVGVSTLFLATVLYLFRNYPSFLGFPRSIIFLYGILLFFLVGALRFSKRIYWQLIRGRTGVLKPKDEFVLPLTSKTLKETKPQNILITGGAGYIGSVLSRQLLKQDYNVKIIDKLLFGKESIEDLQTHPNFQLIKGDILDTEIVKKALFDIDAVIHLAAIVGEPACASKQDVALQTNYLGTVYLARLCKAFGIKRFIQASTCSTYGQQDNNKAVAESGRLYPVDFYGETKIYAERELIKLMDESFSPTILRFSTVYGLSPRMRFDLVVNALSKKAVKDKEIFIFGGNQWRPLIHVNDAVMVISLVLKSPFSKVGNQIFNAGANSENYLISRVGELVKESIPELRIKTINGIEDKRSYKVDFSKIEQTLNFRTEKKVRDGIIEIRDAIKQGRFSNPEDKIYYNHLV